jgi:hypothetical protein
MDSFDSRPAAPNQLLGAERGQHRKMKCTHP